jgi:hypothetical protein
MLGWMDDSAGSPLPLRGGCLCGGVRFEVTEYPTSASYCHCTRCQRRTGGGSSAQTRVVPGSVRVLAGADLVRLWEPPDGFGKAFCSVCGSALWSVPPGADEPAGIRFSAFDDDPGVRPSYRTFTAYAAHWEPIPDDGLPRYPERLPPSA